MIRKLKVSACMLATCAVLLIGYRISGGFARLVADYVSRPMSALIASLTSRTPIPVAELLCIAGVALLFRLLIVNLWTRARRKHAGHRGAMESATVIVSALALAYVLLWSAQLYAPKLDGMRPRPLATWELAEYCGELTAEANLLSGTASDWDVPPHGVKRSRYPELMKLLGMGGVYVPWTGEVIISGLEPNLSLPFIAAHEAAHAQGYAREDEANYIAYQACMTGGVRSRYSGTMYALYYAMEALHDADEATWRRTHAQMNEAVQGDYYRLNGLRTARAPRLLMWRDHAVAAFQRVTKDAAVPSYGDVVNLLLASRYPMQ